MREQGQWFVAAVKLFKEDLEQNAQHNHRQESEGNGCGVSPYCEFHWLLFSGQASDANDPKLSDSRSWRDGCMVGGKAEAGSSQRDSGALQCMVRRRWSHWSKVAASSSSHSIAVSYGV